MRSPHSSSDSFPFRYSGSISSASGSGPGKARTPLEKITGFDIIQPVPPRLNLPQTICLYQYDVWSCAASSRVICRSASSSELGPVLILSYQLRRRSFSKCRYIHPSFIVIHLVEEWT